VDLSPRRTRQGRATKRDPRRGLTASSPACDQAGLVAQGKGCKYLFAAFCSPADRWTLAGLLWLFRALCCLPLVPD